jgi:hypothetical protein
VGIENDFYSAGAIIEVENFFPGFAAIAGAEDAALRVGAVGVAERGDEDDVGVCGVDDDVADVAGIFESDVAPGFAGVGGFVDAIAERNIAADAGFTGAGVEYVGIGVRYGNAADGGDALLVKEGIPGEPAVRCFPDAAADRAEIIGIGLAGHACDGDDTAAAEGADEAPFHGAVGFEIDLLGLGDSTTGKEEERDTEKVGNGLAKRFHTNLRDSEGNVACYHW